jgi:hypothetical protein
MGRWVILALLWSYDCRGLLAWKMLRSKVTSGTRLGVWTALMHLLESPPELVVAPLDLHTPKCSK